MATTVLGLWCAVVEPNKQFTFDQIVDLQITNATLDETASGSERSVVKLRFIDEHDPEAEPEDDDSSEPDGVDKTTVLCTLTPGKTEQTTLNILLPENEAGYTFSVTGKNKVHLSGHYILQHGKRAIDEDSDDYDSEEDDSEGGLYDDSLGLPYTDDEDDEDDDDDDEEEDESRFEEIAESPKKSSKKRAAPDDDEAGDVSMLSTMTVDSSASIPADGDLSKLSKNQRKKLAKKLKTENGTAVPTGAADTNEAVALEEVKKEVKKEIKEAEKKEKKVEKKEEKKKVTLQSGVSIEDAKVGSGPKAKAGQRVQMRYIGTLPNGKKFDSNTKGKPFEFRLGKGEVIKGWDEGIKGMAVGGERKLIIPAAAGYGKAGAPPDIPPNATLHFQVKLLAIK